MSIALVTCADLPEADVDEPLLLGALADAGVPARMVDWDDPQHEWTAFAPTFDALVVRSTWNYHHDLDGFLGWVDELERAGAHLMNPPAAIRWNTHKRYMRELQQGGIPIVPTEWLDRGSGPPQLSPLFSSLDADRIVVKPAVSAGSFATIVAGPDDIATLHAHIAKWLPERDMMVQRYMPQVESSGERSLVWIGGEVTHSVRKSLRLASDDEAVSEALEPTDRERMFAASVLDAAGFDGLLYARIDYVLDERTDAFTLMELELVEPSLFLAQHPPALARLVECLGQLRAGST